ncbi:hypothetical protein EVAR_30514_1 [Eumeta japonica]|uniref:Uncharacterized protein n=1 Tax=Eumeta variegata TaxID=151549 RepID=A0A4C1VYK6_EUMVA|nr:hypothetical protein EVAR_30514_1 [Eumeta japonica]
MGPCGTTPNKGGEASLYVVFCVAGTKCCVGKHSVITGNNRSRRMLRAIPRIPPATSPCAAFSCSQRRTAAPAHHASPDINLH